jgi:hypothetical protein
MVACINQLKEEPHDFYSTLNIIRVSKSRRVRWVGHLICMAAEKSTQNVGQKAEGRKVVVRP